MRFEMIDKTGVPPTAEEAKEALRAWDSAVVSNKLMAIPELMLQMITMRSILKIYITVMRQKEGAGPSASS